uniref:Seven TM Receptor n=1 Tax=Rhabditophanes sp. KR3021 TaxID=114890 RepID=A0AC35UCR1_9BILA
MHFFPTKHYALACFVIGLMIQAHFVPGVNVSGSHGICQQLESKNCLKISCAFSISICFATIGVVALANMMKYNVFCRKKDLMYTSIYEKIIYLYIFVIGPVSIFGTVHSSEIYAYNQFISLDPNDLKILEPFLNSNYYIIQLKASDVGNTPLLYALGSITIGGAIIFVTGVYYYIYIELSLWKAAKEALTNTAQTIKVIINLLRFQNACLIIFCFIPIMMPFALIVFDMPPFAKSIVSNIFLFILLYYVVSPFVAFYHFYKPEMRAIFCSGSKIIPYTTQNE